MSDAIETPAPETPVVNPPEPKLAIKLTDQEKENFLKALLSDTPYSETVPGKFSLKVKTLTVNENADVINQITLDQENDRAKSNDAYFVRINAYRLALSLIEINGIPFLPLVTKESFPTTADGRSYISQRAETVLAWQEFKLGLAIDLFREFERKVQALMQAVQDPSF